MELISDNVEGILDSLEDLVARRQALREAGIEPALLEANRLEIARLQRHLSEALITKYSRVAA